jgi:hypothetical protein
LSFCSGYLRVNLFIIRCFDPDSIALINPLAGLVEPAPSPCGREAFDCRGPMNCHYYFLLIII